MKIQKTAPSFLFSLLLSNVYTNAQIVDKSINSIQTGFFGLWWNNEVKPAKNWAFRSKIGYAAPIYARSHYKLEADNSHAYSYPVFQPVLTFELPWYYNSQKRQGNSKNTFHNSGNYFAFPFQY